MATIATARRNPRMPRTGPDRYKWIALSNTTLGCTAGDARRLDHADRDAGHLPRHPPRPAGARQQLLPAVDDPRLPRRLERADRQPRPPRRHVRARADLQPRLPDLHGRLAVPDGRLADRPRRRDVLDRVPDRAGDRRGLPARQRGRDHHGRVSRQPARDGPGDQQHRRRQRPVRRPRARAACWRRSTGGWSS